MTIIEQFTAWVKTKSGEYDYWSSDNCALAQFGREVLGIKHPNAGGRNIQDLDAEYTTIVTVVPSEWAMSPIADKPYTFEALAERLDNWEEYA